ncbi:histone-lysine N-methyltransferase 2C-like [Cylas formicarius]|uniref:histone-lysine N-methyltransferase 2C-like n=1 Tax=Cylas formicarius TaxID=197179 RepID=UPI002958CD54|nr:histone-lysine N-methyltransferase 2C-like [Cylas formicarius]
MDEMSSGLEPDELMDLEEPEPYELEEEDEELTEDPSSSPFQLLSSGPGSTATSAASSPPNTEDFPTPFNFSGKPLSVKRGRGRPRREGGKPSQRRSCGNSSSRVRRSRPSSLSRSRGSRSVRQPDKMDFDFSYFSSSALDDMSLDPDTGALLFPERDRFPPVEDVPYAPEAWPGKTCAFCNLPERSQLGQGEMVRLNCPEGFTPQRVVMDQNSQTPPQALEKDNGDKSPRGPVTCRRNKTFNRLRNQSMTNEYVDELSIIGYNEEPSVNILFETNGQFFVHRNCALWSKGVNRTEQFALENVGPVVLESSSKKCSFCNHYGASLVCKMEGCTKVFHFPCSTASGAFQELASFSVYCSSHLGQAALHCESSVCYTCRNTGDVANLMYCSGCGAHYHGRCVGLAQLPGVRAGWQCRKCRICQVCRMTGDESKLMTCEQCDKVYHASCQRPIVTSIPKYGWKCRCCRVCGDCGSRTPGAGLSSRWHLHYTVCDSCYQQRNKGCSCPMCHRAYRSHAHREMVQCTMCRKFVHGTCDPDADLATYHQRKEANPEYEYVCAICKNLALQSQHQTSRQLTTKRFSTDEPGDLSGSQESLYDDMSEFDVPLEESVRNVGLGKGKPFASKIAKKRLSFQTGKPGRPKGSYGKGAPGKQGFMKRQRSSEFVRKRGPKAKMRGVFGAPGVGLQRPVSDGKGEDEPGVENRLVLCSAKDKFVLTQDICVMCGALGTDQEGCLISCVQCGQCYHPYCVNVKITKVILQKGWRCLDCTVCEGCGQRNDEGRLILCDDCDVSYHTYCMDPPLDYVPHGNWKCKWCACCRNCGATDPGFNCTWMNSCTECGPCASHTACPSCTEPYAEGDLIIQCVQCERWLHGACDFIKTEQDAEKCAEEGYNCILCRPRDVPPPHMVPQPIAPKPPTPTKSPELKSLTNYFIDGVCLSESGHNLIKSLSLEYHGSRKKRKKVPTMQDKEAGIMATIESVVAGGSAGFAADNSLEDTKLELVDVKEEPQELYKEGMIWTKEDGPPPEGFTVFTMESGISVLRRKRQRNLQKLGIGGFLVRMRGFRTGQDNDDIDTLPGQTTPTTPDLPPSLPPEGDKPKRKPIRRKPKSKLAETFPAYLQEAFFGKDLMDVTDLKKEVDSGSSDDDNKDGKYHAIKLSAEELMAVASAKQESSDFVPKETKDAVDGDKSKSSLNLIPKDEDEENTEDLKDVLALPGDLLDTDLVNSIINEDDDDLAKNTELEALGDDTELGDTLGSSGNSKDAKDELSDILGSHFNLESIPNINSKDVEDIFKGVLTDESQESQLSQEANIFPPAQQPSAGTMFNNVPQPSPLSIPQMSLPSAPIRPTALPSVNHSNLNSPVSFPPPSPYHSEYSNSPQFSPAFSEPPSPWININEGPEIDSTSVGVPSTYNQRSSEKMKADEGLGSGATISAVLYANMNHPEWKTEYPIWSDRNKQIIKKWRTLSQDQKAPYLQQARDNRSQLRMKKAQQSQTNKDPTAPSPAAPVKQPPTASAATSLPPSSSGPPQPVVLAPSASASSEDQEKISLQQKSAREAEQERQWKQLQALRQQQAQQQQHVIHEQRVQAIARVQRTVSDPNQPFVQGNQTLPLQVATTPQDNSPAASPSPISRQFIGIKSPPFSHLSPQQTATPRTPTSSQSPVHDFQQQHQPQVQAPQTDSPTDPYPQAPATPKPIQFAPRLAGAGIVDAFGQPPTPRPQFVAPQQRPSLQVRPDQPEITRQLRELLQRQQFKNLDLVPGKTGQRVWPPSETQESEIGTPSASSGSDNTFRQPLPPTINRPRIPLPVGARGAMNIRLQPLEGRLQGLDPRMRLILQQQQRLSLPNQQHQLQQDLAGGAVRFPHIGSVRPSTVEQYEQLLHQRQIQLQNRSAGSLDQSGGSVARLLQGGPGVAPRSAIATSGAHTTTTTSANAGAVSQTASNEQEIPDNVTAELEKLEQETGTMAELQGVSDILGGLGDDDDELLAEMGADFNILEYADPELEALAGEKTNILDLELEDDNLKQKKRQAELQKKNASSSSGTAVSTATASTDEIKKDATTVQAQESKAITSATSEVAASSQQQMENVQQHLPVANSVHTPQSSQNTLQQSQMSQPPQQGLPQPPLQPLHHPHLTTQQIHQQMVHQVQQAAAQGRPMPPGSKLQTPDGIVGVVLPNNNVQLQIPSNYPQRLLLHLQNQKLQMRQPVPRMVAQVGMNQTNAGLPGPVMGLGTRPRLNLAAPPPPPPPYPGPPPPYPGVVNPQQQQQMGLRMGPGYHLPMGHAHPMALQRYHMHPHLERRPLLLEEQPLLLEDLLEQEKREQEKQQHQNQTAGQEIAAPKSMNTSEPPLLSDHDFERLKADVFSGGPAGISVPNQGNTGGIIQQGWQQTRAIPTPTPQPTTELTARIQMFNANLRPAPPLPHENIVTEQDKQAQIAYEQWLNHQNNVLNQQLRYFETEVQKLRKSRKSLNSKQRQLRKSGNQLNEVDATELQRISAEQAILQKQLESSRKQSRQHGMLIQEYRNKQQATKTGSSSAIGTPQSMLHSPHGLPSSSPIHHPSTSQSPMMSPQPSPLMQHNSPMHSPGHVVSHSPGPGSVANLLQSPGSMTGSSMSPMQPSPRIGTPLSQGEGSPGPVPSPSQVCLPPPVPRMTSPQHRRVVTSPVGYTGDLRPGTPQMRFVRTPLDHTNLQQRIRIQSPIQNFPTKGGTPSPLNSPPPQAGMTQQQLLQKQLQQQVLMHQQHQIQQQAGGDATNQDQNILHSQRVAQLIQHRNLTRQQQDQQQMQASAQPQPLTPQQHQFMVQQQQQLAKQQQQQIAMQLQGRMNHQQQQQQLNNPPQSPMPPKSPLIGQQIMSPPSMPASPMPPFSSGQQQNMPSSPASRSPFHQSISQPPSSPMMHVQYQTPSSPMIQSPHNIRRPPSASSSPAIPERPTSVENPSTPRNHFTMDSQIQDNMHTGGGNPNNPNNPIPLPPPGFGRFGFFKLGLRGGSPMWAGFGRGEKRVPTPPNINVSTSGGSTNSSIGPDVDKHSELSAKPKKEPHISKVSILKKKMPLIKKSLGGNKLSPLVGMDYNESDDSSSTPPVTPPSGPGRMLGQRLITKSDLDDKQMHVTEIVDYEDDNSTVLSSEISLSSAAQQNDDEMEITETLSQNDMGEILSSPLVEPDQISEEYLLFQENMDISSGVQYSDKEENEEDYSGENMHIVIRSPTTSDDEFIMQGKTKKYILNMADTPESPEQEASTEPSSELPEENFEESEYVVIEQPVKSPEEQISTKEDFEELIDEGSRKEKLLKHEVTAKHISEFHKYAASSVYSFRAKPTATTPVKHTNIINQKMPQKISLITAPIINNYTRPEKSGTEQQSQLILAPSSKLSTNSSSPKVTSIFLTHNSVRSNILNVGPKIVTQSPAITIVSASTSQIASILPNTKFTVPVISASAVRQLPNVKVIDKPSTSLSLTTHDTTLPKKIFEDDSVSPDSSNFEEEKKDSSDEKSKTDSPPLETKAPIFIANKKSDIKPSVEQGKYEIIMSDNKKDISYRLDESHHHQITHIIAKETLQRTSPVLRTTSPVIIHHATPELKMTAQVIQETQPHMQITATETVGPYDGSTEDKSVVISIPSPTPSQEQMLDNIAMQALESRRREFDSFEDVLDMIENMQTPEESEPIHDQNKMVKPNAKIEAKEKPPMRKDSGDAQPLVNVSGASKSVVPQLSPLSQPTDLTTNMANASQQLRTLLSSVQTTTSSSSSNIETVVKTINHKLINSSSSINTPPIVASRIIQQANRDSPLVTTISTVIVPNIKQKVSLSSPSKTSTTSVVHSAPGLSFLSNRTVSGISIITSDYSKLPSVTQQNASVITAQTSQKANIISTTNTEQNVKPSLTLTAMLQNQPAATASTNSSADTITAASLLATPVSLSRSGFSTALVQAQPNVVIASSVASTNNSSPVSTTTNSVITSSAYRNIAGSTNLLHTQLTKVRTKSVDDIKDLKGDDIVKTESEIIEVPKQEAVGCKYSTVTTALASRPDDSQNVLLKKLLQNTACASTQSSPPSTAVITTATSAFLSSEPPKPLTPTLSSLLPPTIKSEPQPTAPQPQPKPVVQRAPIRETSFVSSPVIPQIQTTIASSVASTQQLHIDVKKCAPPSRTSSRDELLSPLTPKSSCSQDSSLQTPPLIIKKEFPSMPQTISNQDLKKELFDETSQHSEVSDQGKCDIQIKEELLESLDSAAEKVLDKEGLKKQKRRMYQQKRRQNQILNKEVCKPNKRPRKNSKLEEDYDTYIDGVLAQIRHLPPMMVSESVLVRNYGVCPVFGSGDLSKLGTKSFDSRTGDLVGTYGNAMVPGYSDFYSTTPYGDEEPLPEKPPPSTQRGFYDQEFPLIRFDNDDEKKFDLFSREDTPDSVVSSSSPECVARSGSPNKYYGLKLISDEEDENEYQCEGRVSPEIPLLKPIPIRLKPAGLYLKENSDVDNKENISKDLQHDKMKPDSEPSPLKDSGNVTVTLTLTSSAAEDIIGVLRDLANILHIPAPKTYQIVGRTSSPPGQKLGMYRTKGKDGKEGAPIDIQTILNGAAKFCKHCDVVILNNMIRKRLSDLPFLNKDSELLSEGEELYFCSSTCYMQFALMHRSPSISEDKAAAIVDHLSQKDKFGMKHRTDSTESKHIIANQLVTDQKDFKSDEMMDTSNFGSYFMKMSRFGEQLKSQMPPKTHKNVSYKYWAVGCLHPNQKHKRLTDKELMEMLYRMGITVTPPKMPDDTRKCMFCQGIGDGVADGPARLLNFDVDKWVHLNCALWSDGVYETVNGALMNLENAIQQSLISICIHCNKFGATIRCFKTRCSSVYHLSCAVKDNAVFYKNKTMYCTGHVPKNEKDNELTTLSVSRRVYVNRDENRQVAAVMHHSDSNNLLRVGSLIFLNVGQLLPHQLQNFHTSNYIYPIGYKIIRFYWSMRNLNKRCRYICSIHDLCGRPEFKIVIQEPPEEDVEYKEQSPRAVWALVLEKIAAIRRENQCLQMFPKFVTGEDLFGLTEPAIVRVLESLPGIETLTDYKFKYGRNPLLELPLAINPTGAARTEPRLRLQTHWKRPHTQRTTGSTSRPLFGPSSSGLMPGSSIGEAACPYSKQFVHSKSSQYKKMKSEWRNNVYLARSKIQGLGLYAARDLEKHTMVIEYIGEVIRTELSECREKQYEAKNRGIYMFRLDDDRVVDATLSGGLARYINHSCNPNCVAETVEIDRDLKIIIFAKRRIQRGEELAYDYKFDIEDDQHKISCMCGAPNCRKWMN